MINHSPITVHTMGCTTQHHLLGPLRLLSVKALPQPWMRIVNIDSRNPYGPVHASNSVLRANLSVSLVRHAMHQGCGENHASPTYCFNITNSASLPCYPVRCQSLLCSFHHRSGHSSRSPEPGFLRSPDCQSSGSGHLPEKLQFQILQARLD